jgi:2-amino-4-hydroxy-6-hydroxymethyldihydropteridine diphosphokinase
MELECNQVYLLLGSNLGEREVVIDRAIHLIAEEIGQIVCKSSVYETEPWGKIDQPGFLNVALEVKTSLTAIEVLERALQIEAKLGRVRFERWGSRIIDIDVIFYNQDVIHIEDRLRVPHPELQNRRFVLEPLMEIAPDFVHPQLNKTVNELYISLADNATVQKHQ